MCKFTNRLFVFLLLGLLQWRGSAAPASGVQRDGEANLLAELLSQDYDYDLHYDQRQTGSENLRLKLDGFVIGLPSQEPSGLMLLTEDLLDNLGDELLFGLGKNQGSTSSPDNTLAYTKPAAPKRKPSPKAEAFIVEIPAPRKELKESRHQVDQSDGGHSAGSRTKQHIFHLLNFMRGNKKV